MKECINCKAALLGRQIKFCSTSCRKKFDYKNLEASVKADLIQSKIDNRKEPVTKLLRFVTPADAELFNEKRRLRLGL